MKRSLVVLPVLTVFLFATGALADDEIVGTDFTQDAVSITRAQVKFSKLAQEKSSTPSIKQLAKKVIDSHQKVETELTSIAAKQNIAVPKALMSADAQDKYNELADKKGTDFEKDYLSEVIDYQQKAVDAFQDQADSGEVPELKSFATRTLPTLKKDLQQFKNIKDNYKSRM